MIIGFHTEYTWCVVPRPSRICIIVHAEVHRCPLFTLYLILVRQIVFAVLGSCFMPYSIVWAGDCWVSKKFIDFRTEYIRCVVPRPPHHTCSHPQSPTSVWHAFSHLCRYFQQFVPQLVRIDQVFEYDEAKGTAHRRHWYTHLHDEVFVAQLMEKPLEILLGNALIEVANIYRVPIQHSYFKSGFKL